MMRSRLWSAPLGSLGVVALSWLCACASTPKPIHTRPARAPEETFDEHALRVRAAEADAQAAAAEGQHSEGMVKAIQLRAATNGAFDDGDGAQGSVRLQLDRPFRTNELSRSKQAAGEAAMLEAKAEAYRAQASTCDESVTAHAHEQRKVYLDGYRGQLTELLARTRAFSAAGTLDPITGARAELQLSRRLLEARSPAAGMRAHPKLGPLPELADQGLALDTDAGRLNERIAAEHPEVRAHLASASEHDHAAISEKRSRIPWFDFVQLDMASGSGAPNLGGRVALEIPLDTGARGRAERHAHLSVGETYRAMGLSAELTEVALRALTELAGFEGDAAAQRAILEQADKADALAKKFLQSLDESPDRVAQLLAEAHAGRMAVLEARERAGKAACVLEYATGTSYDSWPRLEQKTP